MSRRKDEARGALDTIHEYTFSLLKENEYILWFGNATLTGWAGPRRCVVTMTNKRIIIIWLSKKHNVMESMQEIPFESINTFAYTLGLALYVPFAQKRFKPRLYIEVSDKKKVFAFVFDDQQIGGAILEELDKRIPIFHKNG